MNIIVAGLLNKIRCYSSKAIGTGLTILMLITATSLHAENSTQYHVGILSPVEGKIYNNFTKTLSGKLASLASENNINVIVHLHKNNKELHSQDNHLVVTVGSRSAKEYVSRKNSAPAILSLLPRHVIDDREIVITDDSIQTVYADFPAEQYLLLAHLGIPGKKRIGTILGPHSSKHKNSLSIMAKELGIELVVAEVQHQRQIASTLNKLASNVDVFLAIPDQLVHNRQTARTILLTSYRHNIPVVAYSKAYVNAGASISLYAAPEDVAKKTAQHVIHTLLGKKIDKCSDYDVVSVLKNNHVSNMLDIKLGSTNKLREKIRLSLEACDQ